MKLDCVQREFLALVFFGGEAGADAHFRAPVRDVVEPDFVVVGCAGLWLSLDRLHGSETIRAGKLIAFGHVARGLGGD